jgi:hypothetical protein
MVIIHKNTEHQVGRLRISLSLMPCDAQQLTEDCSRLFKRRLCELISSVLDEVQRECGDLRVADVLVLDLGELQSAGFEGQFCQRLERVLRECLMSYGQRIEPTVAAPAPGNSLEVVAQEELTRSFTLREPGSGECVLEDEIGSASSHAQPATLMLSGYEKDNGRWRAEHEIRSASSHAQPATLMLSGYENDDGRWQAEDGRTCTPTPDEWSRGAVAKQEEVVDSAPRSQPDALTRFNSFLEGGDWPVEECDRDSGALDDWLLKQLAAQPARWLLALAGHILHRRALQRLYRIVKPATCTRLCQYLAPLLPLTLPMTQAVLQLCALRYFQQHPQHTIPALPLSEPLFEPDGNEQLLRALFRAYEAASTVLGDWLQALWLQPTTRKILTRQLASDAFDRLQAWFEGGRVHLEPTIVKRKSPSIESHATTSTHSYGQLAGGIIPVSNGGITLLWPLLPGLYQRLGLLDDQRFLDPQSRVNAICWLDEVIWADAEYIEGRMLLNKLLCGLPLNASLMWTPPPSSAKEIMQHWLSTLTEYIQPWRRLGLGDIRQLFLQRPAWLVLEADAFALYIQPEVYDVLLSDWPWPASMVILPWLTEPLTVHWNQPSFVR